MITIVDHGLGNIQAFANLSKRLIGTVRTGKTRRMIPCGASDRAAQCNLH